MTCVRIDKWLWAARFFKTRALAAKACELGRIQSNTQPAKASREVRVGEPPKRMASSYCSLAGGGCQTIRGFVKELLGFVRQSLHSERRALKESYAEGRVSIGSTTRLNWMKPCCVKRRAMQRLSLSFFEAAFGLSLLLDR